MRKGDRVAIYMPMVMELPIIMLACARIGAVHSIVFGGFSSDALAERIYDCQAKVLVTADGAWRGERLIALKKISDEALDKSEQMGHRTTACIVVSHMKRVTPGQSDFEESEFEVNWNDDRDHWWHDEMDDQGRTSINL